MALPLSVECTLLSYRLIIDFHRLSIPAHAVQGELEKKNQKKK